MRNAIIATLLSFAIIGPILSDEPENSDLTKIKNTDELRFLSEIYMQLDDTSRSYDNQMKKIRGKKDHENLWWFFYGKTSTLWHLKMTIKAYLDNPANREPLVND